MGKYLLEVTDNATRAQTKGGPGGGARPFKDETQGHRALQSSAVRQTLVGDGRVLALRSFKPSRELPLVTMASKPSGSALQSLAVHSFAGLSAPSPAFFGPFDVVLPVGLPTALFSLSLQLLVQVTRICELLLHLLITMTQTRSHSQGSFLSCRFGFSTTRRPMNVPLLASQAQHLKSDASAAGHTPACRFGPGALFWTQSFLSPSTSLCAVDFK